jgi:hypothetical protein
MGPPPRESDRKLGNPSTGKKKKLDFGAEKIRRSLYPGIVIYCSKAEDQDEMAQKCTCANSRMFPHRVDKCMFASKSRKTTPPDTDTSTLQRKCK